MDKNQINWIMEYLLRKETPDFLLKKTLKFLPISSADCRVKKTILLHELKSHITTASISETSLKILELLEELYRYEKIPISNAMRSAYCAVAVEITVKYLINSPEDPSGEFFSAVRRIWRGRIVNLEKEGRKSELGSEELVRWGEEIEGALWEVRVAERLVGLNTRRDAVIEMKKFLKEAWEVMGPPVADSMEEAMVEARVPTGNGSCSEGVCEIDLGGEMLREGDGRLDSLGKEKMCNVGDDRNDNVVVVDGDGGGDLVTMGKNCGNEQMEERVGTSTDANHEVGGCDSGKGDTDLFFDGDGGDDMETIGENRGKEQMDERVGTSTDAYHEVDGCDSGKRDQGVFLGGDGGSDMATIGENRGKEQIDERVGTSTDAYHEVGGSDSGKRDKEMRKDNLQLKRKCSSLRPYNRGVKISGVQELRPINFSSKCAILPSAEVKKVWESLKTSSMELKGLVEDPLPDALHTSEVVRSKLATEDINCGPPIGNHSGHVDVPNSNACTSIVLFQPNDANLGNKSSVDCSNGHRRPKLMDRARSAQTFEWNDSIDNFPQDKQQRRRKKRRWTSMEEETLRAGVKKFGEGNWTTIRDFYENIFEYRTGGDLKDKWRNMVK